MASLVSKTAMRQYLEGKGVTVDATIPDEDLVMKYNQYKMFKQAVEQTPPLREDAQRLTEASAVSVKDLNQLVHKVQSGRAVDQSIVVKFTISNIFLNKMIVFRHDNQCWGRIKLGKCMKCGVMSAGLPQFAFEMTISDTGIPMTDAHIYGWGDVAKAVFPNMTPEMVYALTTDELTKYVYEWTAPQVLLAKVYIKARMGTDNNAILGVNISMYDLQKAPKKRRLPLSFSMASSSTDTDDK